ncbi:hypothetical protein K3495_g7574 [Podosphaera aphanis]|nr:hypothetical protein K3495_g7574 [Podosphaera aphanis]
MTTRATFEKGFGTQLSIAEIFGQGTAVINYEAAPEDASEVLPVLEENDSLQQGKSVAIYTGVQTGANTDRVPERRARSIMTPQELEIFEAWKNGSAAITFDWVTARKPVNGGPAALTRHAKRAAALREIYNDPSITSENVMWLSTTHPYMIPLVVTGMKVHNTKRELTGGDGGLTKIELVEVQIIRKANSLFSTKLNALYAEINAIAHDGNMSRKVLQAREHSIKSKPENYRRRQDPANSRRNYVNLPQTMTITNMERVTTGVRDVRHDLLGNIGLAQPLTAATSQPHAPNTTAGPMNTQARSALPARPLPAATRLDVEP